MEGLREVRQLNEGSLFNISAYAINGTKYLIEKVEKEYEDGGNENRWKETRTKRENDPTLFMFFLMLAFCKIIH